MPPRLITILSKYPRLSRGAPIDDATRRDARHSPRRRPRQSSRRRHPGERARHSLRRSALPRRYALRPAAALRAAPRRYALRSTKRTSVPMTRLKSARSSGLSGAMYPSAAAISKQAIISRADPSAV